MRSALEADAREEQLRQQLRELSDGERAMAYETINARLKDPDTYAVCNWCFFAGAHHFYLRRWWPGLFNLLVFVVGWGLIIGGLIWVGIGVLVILGGAELHNLIRSQIIVQEYNNDVTDQALRPFRK